MPNRYLPAAALAVYQAQWNQTLMEQAQILRATETKDALARNVAAWKVLSTIPCRLREKRMPIEQREASELQTIADYQMEVPAGTDVTPKDRVIVNGKILAIGVTVTEAQIRTAAAGAAFLEITESDTGRTARLAGLLFCKRVA